MGISDGNFDRFTSISPDSVSIDALRESETHYRAVVENITDGIAINVNAKYVFVNRAFLRIYGLTDTSQVLGASINSFIVDEDKERTVRLTLARQRGEAVGTINELRIIRPDRVVRWVEASSIRIRYQGAPASLTILRDITERKETAASLARQAKELARSRQQQLAQAKLQRINRELEQASIAKTQILSTASHELKTPLTSIIGYLDRVLKQSDTVGKLNARQQRYLETVERNASRLKALIDDLLEVSRIDSGSFALSVAEFDVLSAIRDVIGAMQPQVSEHRARIVVSVPVDLSITGDSLRFSQVVTNLLSNALKYSPEGATTSITAEDRGSSVHFEVIDNGIGISKVDQKKLFGKFFRADNSSTREVSGTGLGLFIIKHIVKAHGRKIWIKSKEGSGTTVSFTLPRKGPETKPV